MGEETAVCFVRELFGTDEWVLKFRSPQRDSIVGAESLVFRVLRSDEGAVRSLIIRSS